MIKVGISILLVSFAGTVIAAPVWLCFGAYPALVVQAVSITVAGLGALIAGISIAREL